MLKDLTQPLKFFKKKSLANNKHQSIIGIEFENEVREKDLTKELLDSVNLPTLEHWKFHSENSLRHWGFEWVSKPLPFENYKTNVKTLFKEQRTLLKKERLPYTNSIRTSVHVHFDVGMLNTLEIVNFACLYWLLEPVLQHFCGAHRQGNLFCIRLKDSTYTKLEISDALKTNTPLFYSHVTAESNRYSSVNFNSLLKFCTLEFRLMRGVSKENDAFIWIDTLEKIKQFSLQFKDPRELRKWYLEGSEASNLLEIVVGEKLASIYKNFLPEEKPLEELIREGYLSILQILQATPVINENTLKKEEEENKTAQEAALKTLIASLDLPQYTPEYSEENDQEHLFSQPTLDE